MENGGWDRWRRRSGRRSPQSETPERASGAAVARVPPPPLTAARLRDHDNTYSEAQELLADWLSSKLKLELEDDWPDEAEGHGNATEHAYVPFGRATGRGTAEGRAPKSFDEYFDQVGAGLEDGAVDALVKGMLEKEVVQVSFLDDLGLQGHGAGKTRDPRLTMDLRHQKVREAAERRAAEGRLRRAEASDRAAADAEARRSLAREDRERALGAEREEAEIRREAARLRSALRQRRQQQQQQEEERRRAEHERRSRERQERRRGSGARETTENRSRRALERAARDRERLRGQRELQARLHAERLKCLSRCFSAWYRLALERRLALGKALALADWRRRLRAFGAWRSRARARRARRETGCARSDLREEHRKTLAAEESHRLRTLGSRLAAWRGWARREREGRELARRRDETRRKMEALLRAAADGALTRPEDRAAREGHAERRGAREGTRTQRKRRINRCGAPRLPAGDGRPGGVSEEWRRGDHSGRRPPGGRDEDAPALGSVV
uniref:Coiled-coil domain-containing protein 191-like n=1 Tax=Petromyzon marinus TaxID=7757 RepID=A0AAJ7UE09_PETMA|nr:coiled-coil domain-containing protein 191-like [Petromyzon marinus]